MLIVTLIPIIGLVICLTLLVWPDGEQPDGLRLIRIGYMQISDCVPLLDTQTFRDHKIILDLKRAPGGSLILSSVISESLDIGFTNLVSPILAEEQGNRLVVFGACSIENPNSPAHQIIVSKSSKITTISQLRGKRIAVNTLRNIDHLMLQRWLKEKGIGSNDVNLVEIPFPQMLNVLKKGDVDAIAVVEPFMTMAIQAGYKPLGNYFLEGGVKSVEVAAYAAKASWAEKNPRLIIAFETALNESVKKLTNDPEAYRLAIIKATKLPHSVAKEINLPTFGKNPTLEGLSYLHQRLINEQFIQNGEEIVLDEMIFNRKEKKRTNNYAD